MSNASATWPVYNQQTEYPKPDYTYPNAEIGLTYADSAADFPQPDQALRARRTSCWSCSMTSASAG